MSLRMLARENQLTVQLTQVSLPDKWDKTLTKTSVCAYHLYRKKEQKNILQTVRLVPYEVWKYTEFCEHWWCSTLEIALSEESRAFLTSKNEQFTAIEITPHGVSLYWLEQGDIQDVPKIKALLVELSLIC